MGRVLGGINVSQKNRIHAKRNEKTKKKIKTRKIWSRRKKTSWRGFSRKEKKSMGKRNRKLWRSFIVL